MRRLFILKDKKDLLEAIKSILSDREAGKPFGGYELRRYVKCTKEGDFIVVSKWVRAKKRRLEEGDVCLKAPICREDIEELQGTKP